MISIKNKFLFIHVPKTGGNSIQLVLQKYSDDKIVNADENMEVFNIKNDIYQIEKHSPLSLYKKLLARDVYNSLYKFCAIRNPWDMVISYYFYYSPHWKDFHGGYDAPKELKPVSDGVWNEELFINVMNMYIKPLRYFICIDKNKKLTEEMDYVMRFENLNEEFQHALDNIGIERRDLLFKNKTKHEHYKEYYNDKLKDLVYNKFKEEIDYFNFEF